VSAPHQKVRTAGGAVAAIAIAAAILSGCGSSGGGGSSSTSTSAASSPSSLAPIHGTYAPSIDPANFVSTIDNPYLLYKPGITRVYQGVAEDGKTRQTDTETVTHQTKRILGVDSTVVRDTVSQHGHPVEKTFDWYAQDQQGDVWYMGEATRELEHGKFVKASDSWEAGVNGAEPGIVMPGNPQPGDVYRQEYYPRYALDQARVLGSGGPVKVPLGSYKETLMTEETAPQLDPGVAERKYYVAGVGDVKEQTVKGNHEQIQLIRLTR
jgi:hypothetical protein